MKKYIFCLVLFGCSGLIGTEKEGGEEEYLGVANKGEKKKTQCRINFNGLNFTVTEEDLKEYGRNGVQHGFKEAFAHVAAKNTLKAIKKNRSWNDFLQDQKESFIDEAGTFAIKYAAQETVALGFQLIIHPIVGAASSSVYHWLYASEIQKVNDIKLRAAAEQELSAAFDDYLSSLSSSNAISLDRYEKLDQFAQRLGLYDKKKQLDAFLKSEDTKNSNQEVLIKKLEEIGLTESGIKILDTLEILTAKLSEDLPAEIFFTKQKVDQKKQIMTEYAQQYERIIRSQQAKKKLKDQKKQKKSKKASSIKPTDDFDLDFDLSSEKKDTKEAKQSVNEHKNDNGSIISDISYLLNGAGQAAQHLYTATGLAAAYHWLQGAPASQNKSADKHVEKSKTDSTVRTEPSSADSDKQHNVSAQEVAAEQEEKKR